jgi:glycosyltransferase involved in cell wall biosynthesis
MPSSELAVITRTRSRPYFLARLFRSLARQRYRKFHHIIVNDNGDEQPIKELIDRLPGNQRRNITLINHETQKGMEAASNTGIQESDSRYIVIFDDDDTWHPCFLEECVSFLNAPANQGHGGVVTQTVRVAEWMKGTQLIPIGRKTLNPRLVSVSFADLYYRNRFTVNAFCFRRDAYKAIGPYRKEFPVLGDWEFNLRFSQRFSIGVIPRPLANYHQRIANKSTGANETSRISRQEQDRLTNLIRAEWLTKLGSAPELPPAAGAEVSMFSMRSSAGDMIMQVVRNILHVARHGID